MRSLRSTTQSCSVLSSHHVHARRADQLVAEDFADAAGRRDHRLHAGRQLRVLQPVERLLAHEMIVAAVFELQADEAERVDGVGADEFQARRAGDRDLDRDRDVALDLLGRLAGLLGDDLDDRRRRIGIGLDVQRQERDVAEAEKGRERDQHQQPPGQAKRDQTTQHEWPRPTRSLTPLVVDEDRAARDDQFAGSEAAADLRQAVLLDPDLDHAALEQHRLGLDPHGGDVAFADHRVGRHRRRRSMALRSRS